MGKVIRFSMEKAQVALCLLSFYVVTAIAVLHEDPSLVLFTAAAFFLLPKVFPGKEKTFLFSLSFALRMGLLFVVTEWNAAALGTSVIYTGGDSQLHFKMAEDLTRSFSWFNFLHPPLNENGVFLAGTYAFGPLLVFHTGYVFFLSVFGHLGDLIHAHSQYTFMWADILAGSLIPVLTYEIASRGTKSESIAMKAALLTACYPLAIFYSGNFMKDSFATFLLLILMKCFFFGEKKRRLAGSLVWLWLMLVRCKVALVVAPFLIWRSLSDRPAPADQDPTAPQPAFFTLGRGTKRGILWIVLAAGILAAFWKFHMASTLLQLFTSTQEIQERSTVKGLTRAIYELPAALKPFGMLLLTLTLPIPPWRSLTADAQSFPSMLFSDLGALYWYAALPFVLIGLRECWKRIEFDDTIGSLFAYLIATMALSYWIDDRRRLMALPFGFILCAIGYQESRAYRRQLAAGVAGFAYLGASYLVLKWA